MEKEFTIKRDGLDLAAKISIPDKENFDLAILAYGFAAVMDNCSNDLLPVLAEKLQDQGIATIRFDFNGHGKSDGSISNMSMFNELEDYNAVINYALHLKGLKRLYLIGHSQGGALSSMIAGYYADKVDKLVLMAPAAHLVDDAKRGRLFGVNYDPNHAPESVHLNMWERFHEDDFDLNGWYFRTARFLNIYDVAQNFHGPVLAIHGEDDSIVNNYTSQHYQAIYDNCELHLIPDSNHGLQENRDMVYNYILDFLK